MIAARAEIRSHSKIYALVALRGTRQKAQ